MHNRGSSEKVNIGAMTVRDSQDDRDVATRALAISCSNLVGIYLTRATEKTLLRAFFETPKRMLLEVEGRFGEGSDFEQLFQCLPEMFRRCGRSFSQAKFLQEPRCKVLYSPIHLC